MTKFIKPDRSNRPQNQDDLFAKSFEYSPDKEISGVLNDGREFINESSVLDGYIWVDYYYFDVKGLENASTEELKMLISNSGIDLIEEDDSAEEVHFSNEKVKDAKGRDIFEFSITRTIDNF